MASILLIHGAWHGAWCYRKVTPLLTTAGHTARAIDLPGHAGNGRPGWGVSLEHYARAVVDAISVAEGRTHLVGHSMGGLVISRAAELAPERVASLTYLCAFLPRNGESLMGLARSDAGTRVPEVTKINLFGGVANVDTARAGPIFYGDCDAADIAEANRLLTPQPLRPFLDSVRITASRFGSRPRYYIACTQDQAITIGRQRHMLEQGNCRKTATLETSHSPFFSAPDAVADAITGFVADAGARAA
jgi:pimeloyl-ACP methyl ester carboxylesterase